MKKTVKFLAIGLSAFAMLNGTSYATSPSEINFEKKVKKSIQSSISLHHKKGFLTKRNSIMNINFFNNDKGSYVQRILPVNANTMEMVNGICNINLMFTNNGEVPYFNLEKKNNETFKFKNENQKEIVRKFVALHEYFHCEFVNVDQPVIAFNKDKKFNKDLNYILKDEISAMYRQSAYINILNENFADVAATFALIKEYGKSNEDLITVIKMIINKREEGHSFDNNDSHASHISLEDAISPHNLEKIKKIKNAKNFVSLVLEIANRGTQNVIASNPDMLKEFKSFEHIETSIYLHLVNHIHSNVDERENQSNLNISKGFTYNVSKIPLEKDTIEYFKRVKEVEGEGQKSYFVNSYASRMFEDIREKLIMEDKEYKRITAILEEFSLTFSKDIRDDKVITSEKNKEEISNKISTLRANYSSQDEVTLKMRK